MATCVHTKLNIGGSDPEVTESGDVEMEVTCEMCNSDIIAVFGGEDGGHTAQLEVETDDGFAVRGWNEDRTESTRHELETFRPQKTTAPRGAD